MITVTTPTHLAGIIDFENGAVGTIITSFDVWFHSLPVIEIYGSEGTLSVPDPNGFGGPVRLRKAGESEWTTVPLMDSDMVSRGVGVAELAYALRCGRSPRTSGELAFHVLDVMQSFDEASKAGRHIRIKSSCERPAPFLPGLFD